MARSERQRVTFVADELLGYAGNGIGTTTAFVSIALARRGHDVEVLFAGNLPDLPVAPEWQRLYDEAGVRVRLLPRVSERIEPRQLVRSWEVDAALRSDPPDVVVVQDLGAPAYVSIRLRSLGLAFGQTSFVVFCHGTRQWITDVSGKVRVHPGALAVTLFERASVESADAVVSPSAYLADWMQGQGWRLPERTFVIPHVSRAGATGASPRIRASNDVERVERVVFFGRIEERKGVRPFVEALNALPADLLRAVDVEFLGRPTAPWPVQRIRELLSGAQMRSLSFETSLDQHEALARLRRPGTLAVVPSFAENSPNTIYECLENGIPFIASNAAGIRELVAPEDHQRVLFEPTAEGVAAALQAALTTRAALRPALPAYDDEDSLRRWSDLLAAPADRPRAEAREAEWALALAPGDVAEPQLKAILMRVATVSGADIVTCGTSVVDETIHLFPGEPRALGLLSNGYGTTALVRGELAESRGNEPVWPWLARLAASGARIVSVPLPLVRATAAPATFESHPDEALQVLEHLERALPSSARLTAELALRTAAAQDAPAVVPRSRARRIVRRLIRGHR